MASAAKSSASAAMSQGIQSMSMSSWFKNGAAGGTKSGGKGKAGSEEAAVSEVLKHLRLVGSEHKHHTEMIVAKVGDRPLGTPADRQILGWKWFRTGEHGMTPLVGAAPDATMIQPNIDDVGSSLCVQCYSLANEDLSKFAAFGPIALDPQVAAVSKSSKEIVCRELDTGSTYKVKVRSEKADGRGTGEQPIVDLILARQGDEDEAEEEVQVVRLSPSSAWTLPESYSESDRVQLTIPGDSVQGTEAQRLILVFDTPTERDAATLLIRRSLEDPDRPAPNVSESALDGHAAPKVDGASSSESSGTSGTLELRVKDLEMQLAVAMAGLAKAQKTSGAAEVGKALAQAQTTTRELDKSKQEVAKLTNELTASRNARTQLEGSVQRLESEQRKAADREKSMGDSLKELARVKEEARAARDAAKDAAKRAEEARAALDALDQSVHGLRKRAEVAEESCTALSKRIKEMEAEVEKLTTRRNAAQQKAESLKQDLSRLLRTAPGGIEEIEATVKENETLRKQLQEARAELRHVRTVAGAGDPDGKKRPGVNNGTSGATKAKARVPSEIGHIANLLMQDVQERDETIETQRAEIEKLQRRVEEAFRRLREAGGM